MNRDQLLYGADPDLFKYFKNIAGQAMRTSYSYASDGIRAMRDRIGYLEHILDRRRDLEQDDVRFLARLFRALAVSEIADVGIQLDAEDAKTLRRILRPIVEDEPV